MSEELVIAQCSPTLAGLKTASLFRCGLTDRADFLRSLHRLNLHLVPKGVRLIPVRLSTDSALVYMYRPQQLKSDLEGERAKRTLRGKGYPTGDANACLAELIRRIRTAEEFPHEIGLFLGYPPEDVEGFITQKARHAKYSGLWKVYGDVESAKRRFDMYKKCTRIYKEAFLRHNSFDRLVVSCV